MLCFVMWHNPKYLSYKPQCEGCSTAHLPHEINLNANLMQEGNFINEFLIRHVSGTYVHHQEH